MHLNLQLNATLTCWENAYFRLNQLPLAIQINPTTSAIARISQILISLKSPNQTPED